MRISDWSSDVCSSDLADIVVRIFREYAEGKSAKAIAAGLNTDGIVGPRGGIWRQNTINGNRARGTGILNNELYVGWLVWNRLEYKTKSVNLGGRQAAPRKSTAKPRVSRLRRSEERRVGKECVRKGRSRWSP